MKFLQSYRIALLIFILIAVYGCANVVPPSGGEKDTTPPVLLSMLPADSGLNTRTTKIELRFNKFMEVKELEKNLQLSPILPTTPSVESYGRRVIINIPDSQLLSNTTYRIGLGNALTDNREYTPYKDFVYVFSTGSYFDSLELRGKVIDAKTGLKDSAILVVLYAATETDTAVMRKKPLYAARIDASGNFNFKSLPKKTFKMYAFQDGNNNYIYDYAEEKIGFLNTDVTPSLDNDSSYTFYTFKEIKDTSVIISEEKDTIPSTDSLKQKPGLRKNRAMSNQPVLSKLSKTNIGYKVNVDTSDVSKRTFDIREPLSITLTAYLSNLDSAKLYLSYENNGIEVEALQKINLDSGKIKISTQWLGDKIYTLRLVKGWAKDSSGSEFPPGKYKFRTKGDQDYSNLIIHLNKAYVSDSMVLNVFKGADSIHLKTITDSIVTIRLLEPGNYEMQIIEDVNRNGKWDPGVLLKKRQPEKIINHNTTILLKAGWDNEVDFSPMSTESKKPVMSGDKLKEEDSEEKEEPTEQEEK